MICFLKSFIKWDSGTQKSDKSQIFYNFSLFSYFIITGSSSQSSHLKPILDKLLNLVQSLLLQELKQSTLDEIFTLLEPYLKLPEKLAREMAITILHATLKTFLENRFPLENHLLNESSSSSDSTTISTALAFSPGPYIMGSLVPRCFDGSKLVQSNSLACLQLLVSSLYMYPIYYLVLQMSKKFSEMKSHLK